MSQQIDSFCEKLRGKLDEMDDRLQQLKASAKAGSEKARQDLHSQAEKLRANLDADRASIEAAKTRMKDWAAGKKATFDEKVVQWKAQRTQEQLKRRRQFDHLGRRHHHSGVGRTRRREDAGEHQSLSVSYPR